MIPEFVRQHRRRLLRRRVRRRDRHAVLDYPDQRHPDPVASPAEVPLNLPLHWRVHPLRLHHVRRAPPLHDRLRPLRLLLRLPLRLLHARHHRLLHRALRRLHHRVRRVLPSVRQSASMRQRIRPACCRETIP